MFSNLSPGGKLTEKWLTNNLLLYNHVLKIKIFNCHWKHIALHRFYNFKAQQENYKLIKNFQLYLQKPM